ncbi:acyl-CoA N-acyltransferase [Decorospora gaudefroyi]|uniref:Acyl-CoA N-acyltransferase n=1 Tax=Decorospora gaudefroyi TaxID=184978 RepID=A0A6A5JZA2_9PLEO|nr:acyl-CoA N-acyltransferase [Decorospora gaudefroyi]
MAQQKEKAPFIKVPTDKTGGFQTMPTDSSRRLSDKQVRIELCTEADAEEIAEGLYLCFPPSWWATKEPPELRPPHTTRIRRMAKRLTPALRPALSPHTHFVKAVLVATGEMVGLVCWTGPGNPGIHCALARSAVAYYGWQAKMGWSDEEVAEMWSHVSDEGWNGVIGKNDEVRRGVFGAEPHWFLAPLMTWPDYQGRGIGSRLLKWAIDQADQTDPVTPLYLESAPSARPVYMHYGFVPLGEYNMVRRGPAIVRGLEADEEKEGQEWAQERKVDADEERVN